jgi:hypothetical protein
VSALDDHLTRALAEHVLDRIAARGPGHCLQIPHVPKKLADAACRLVRRSLGDSDFSCVVTPSPNKDWQAKPAKVVEIRNGCEATGGKLVVFVPAGSNLAAEDSFGRSTFEVLDVLDIHASVVDRLRGDMQRLAPDLAERVEDIVAMVRRDERFAVGDREVAAFLAAAVEHPSENGVATAMTELGLLPDEEVITADGDDVPVRLARNLQQMEILTDAAPPIDRVHRLASNDSNGASDLAEVLVDALADGTTDRKELAGRLAIAPSPERFADLISDVGERPRVEELTVVSLSGDFQKGSEPPTLTRKNSAVKIKYRCRPSAATIAGLHELRLELLSVTDQGRELGATGVEAVKRGKSLPKNTEGTWSLRLDLETLDAGMYEVRIRAYDQDNLLLAEDSSERFRILEELEPILDEPTSVPSVAAARATARAEHPTAPLGGIPRIEISETAAGTKPLTFLVTFDGASGRAQIEIARALAMAERYSLQDPRTLARYRINLAHGELDHVDVPDAMDDVPAEFLDARQALFEEICRAQWPVEGGESPALVALCDLRSVEREIDAYVRSWRIALEAAPSQAAVEALLGVDQVTFSDGQLAGGVLIGPTHPLRIGWLVKYEQTLHDWATGPEPDPVEAHDLRRIVAALAPAHLPHVVISRGFGELRYVEPIDLYWGLWAPPNAPDVGAIASALRARLHLPPVTVGSINVEDVVQRVRRYLAAHPYVDLLQVNFVQAGSAEVVLRTLMSLQSEPSTSELRYIIRLFATDLSRSELGGALDDFMNDPDTLRNVPREAADAFISSTEEPLAPKLTYSKHATSELLERPDRFPAHLTFFLDWFELDAVPVPPLPDRRSFFANGLIVDPVVVYRPGSDELNPQWDEHVAPPPITDDEMTRAFVASETATARQLDESASGTVPAVRLELDKVRRSILDAVHRTSDWVVVIDPVFADEYLDTPPPPGEGPRYLIDSRDPGALETTRRVMVSTRSRVELVGLFKPIIERYELPVPVDRIETLVDALHALSPGLALRLLNNRTQALEALSLALGALYLNAAGILRRALVIPLDLHQELFREEQGRRSDTAPDLRRTDLAVVQLDPEHRRIAVTLVEVKARGQIPQTLPAELVEQVSAQLSNSREVLRERLFAAGVRRQPGSLAAALTLRRLSRLLSRYLERGARYGFFDSLRVPEARRFISSLDRSYQLVFDEHALFFDFDGELRAVEHLDQLTAHRIGRNDILDLLERTQTPVGTQAPSGDTEIARTVLFADVGESPEEVPGLVEDELCAEEVGDDVVDEQPLEEGEGCPGVRAPEPARGPEPDDVLLVGMTPDSRQFGIVGRVAGTGKPVAFDVDGTNVVSVFGVQGSGKSYTVGNLIEAALIAEPSLNRLPHPLAGVIFHYSTDQSYQSEFGSMADINDSADPVAHLQADYGASPRAVQEVVVLVPRDLVAERADDFPGLPVEPLVLAPDELSLNDWRLLMGVEGGDQLYVKAMSNLFRGLRGNLTVDGLKKAVDSSRLSPAQKDLAHTRIEFVENFVSDGGGVGQHIRQGRLVLVDVRDPWLEEDNALALFMVLLRLCAQAMGPAGEPFNKVIVFDEAHKYMDNSRLTKAIVETVREMRHKGTSVIVASQNPPSIPREIIELSSVIIAHKFTSPQWLEHIRKVNAAFGKDLSPARLATLRPGEAFVWSSGGAEDFRRPQRVTMRPRLTRHGGATKRAAE